VAENLILARTDSAVIKREWILWQQKQRKNQQKRNK